MNAFFQKIIPERTRQRLRIVRQEISDDFSELMFLINVSERSKNRKRLDSLSQLNDLFQFAAEEFHISQNPTEILPFIELARSYHPTVIGEVGTFMGGNAFLFSRSFPALQKLILVDLKVKNRNKLHYYAPEGVSLQSFNGFSCATETLKWVDGVRDDRQFDLIFIDGDHEYAGVKEDLVQYSQWVREGGLIAFHDIIPDHFVRFGRKGPFYAGYVHRLWAQLKPRFKHWEFIADPNQNGAGIGVIECDSKTREKLLEISKLKREDT